ncbi:NAD(P)-dependent oxidoreductase [Pseudonocardia sp.]|uniref:SDR family oxidoreductase n=1 Tax=Pseudonocardia sp. TaxID=60912 RepID=UPI0031FC49D6
MRALIIGAGGQVGRALAAALPQATALSRRGLDITEAAGADIDWSSYDTLVNAAAFTDVDGAETTDGRVAAWQANAVGPASLAHVASEHNLTLVHLSTEYVFDGRADEPYHEDAPIAPLSAYGASKAAGDLAVGTVERHYLMRPTWVMGEGRNFVRTMLALAARGVEPTVVGDQIGRPTFAQDIAAAIVHLVSKGAPYGTYHVTGSGEPASWAEVARATYALSGHGDLAITETSTEAYFADKPQAARRPLNSVLDLSRAERAGVALPNWRDRLADYVSAALS